MSLLRIGKQGAFKIEDLYKKALIFLPSSPHRKQPHNTREEESLLRLFQYNRLVEQYAFKITDLYNLKGAYKTTI